MPVDNTKSQVRQKPFREGAQNLPVTFIFSLILIFTMFEREVVRRHLIKLDF